MRGDVVRERLAAGETVVMPGVWDPLAALVAAEAGFGTVFLSGYCLSAAALGVPDIGLLTQTEVADAARRISAAVPDVALVVDGDTGYGGVTNTARTVALWEQAGAAGVFLEDQVAPKRCGHMAGKEVTGADEWLAKLRTALAEREHLFVTARTDARAPLGLDAALDRARAARDLGVDAVFVEAPDSVDELERVAAALPDVPLVANMVETGRTPLLTPAELHELGFDLIVSPLSLLFAATAAMRELAGTLHGAGTLRDDLDRLIAFDDFTALVGLDRWQALGDRFDS